MRNLKLTIQYEGTRYNGWQIQKNTPRTIQEIIENILAQILREKVKLTAAGRTDTGVHASMQVANFKTRSRLLPAKLHTSLNSLLPDDIKVTRIREAPPDFHSRYCARSKTYRYTILNRAYSDVFERSREYFYPYRLDVSAMRTAARLLVGKHDFSSFRKTDRACRRTPVRTLSSIRISTKAGRINLDFIGAGFLHNMVRSIVGTLIEIGRGKMPAGSITAILKAKNRTAAGPTAPARGLTLLKVQY
ncbi:MAG: tRNA pseudouridine(38-40) synthase TruA [Candidatus Omnitrophica bacterium]|nr:tRNA pseudouridine(38-40) synthase TruA [Candidatus Omnitrophota bacterium]